MNPLAVLLTMTNAVFTLLITLALKTAGTTGIWYAVSGAGGALIGNCIATAVALQISGLGWSAFTRPGAEQAGNRPLEGSLWMFVVGLGHPLGFQSQHLILSHVSTSAELSRYALIAQVYAVIWMVFGTAGMALWPVFVKCRPDTRASTRLWLRSMAAFGALSATVRRRHCRSGTVGHICALGRPAGRYTGFGNCSRFSAGGYLHPFAWRYDADDAARDAMAVLLRFGVGCVDRGAGSVVGRTVGRHRG